MKNLYMLDSLRIRGPAVMDLWGWEGDGTCGAFQVPSPIDKAPLKVIASVGEGWDHVSISRHNRCPNWVEMEFVKRLFFEDNETAVQFHVPGSDHVNMHPTCLHLWRCLDQEIPRPPSILVGIGNQPVRDLAEAKLRLRDTL